MRKYERFHLIVASAVFFGTLLLVMLTPTVRNMAIVETGDPVVADILTIFSILSGATGIAIFIALFLPRREYPR